MSLIIFLPDITLQVGIETVIFKQPECRHNKDNGNGNLKREKVCSGFTRTDLIHDMFWVAELWCGSDHRQGVLASFRNALLCAGMKDVFLPLHCLTWSMASLQFPFNIALVPYTELQLSGGLQQNRGHKYYRYFNMQPTDGLMSFTANSLLRCFTKNFKTVL